MYYSDGAHGRPFAKDPDVVRFQDRYLMYYSIDRGSDGFAIGIAESDDLTNWKKVGEVLPEGDYERRGLAAPAAMVRDGKVHLFYQTYGNGPKDAICHAFSDDGLRFTRNLTNPIFRPTGDWNVGRAIDAEVIEWQGRLLLYCATRDPQMRVQKLVVAGAPIDSDWGRDTWTQLCDASILEPELPWEQQCIEAAAVIEHDGRLYMFYAGAYNNSPQQIGCAVSTDGISWKRLSNEPLLPNGAAHEWNASESGHPGVFRDDDGQTYLFFQGNNDNGASWYLSKMNVGWDNGLPYLVRPRDNHTFRIKESLRPVVKIDAGARGEPISKYIYGQFIEHLGRCIYGGIWAEMLEDRKFLHPAGADPSAWEIIGSPDGVTMERRDSFVGEHTPMIRAASGMRQRGLGLVEQKRYTGRIWIKPATAAGANVEVSLVWDSGPTQRASIYFTVNADRYIQCPLDFTTGASTGQAMLEVRVSQGSALIGTLSLMPSDNVNGMRADTLKLLKQLNAPIYRWPGGNFVSGYNWRDGIGPRDKRPPRKNPAWQGIEHNDFGLDEFITFCRGVGAEPMIAVNSGFGDDYSAAQQVEYANGSPETLMGQWRAVNGNVEPYGVIWWCVGNEMFGAWQLGHMALDQYVLKHNLFAEAMWSVDPNIKLIGVGAAGNWSEGMLTHCAGAMDLISEHFYCQERDSVVEHAGLMPDAVRGIVNAHRDYRTRLDSLEGKDIRIAIDEWNYWYGEHIFGELGTRYFMKDALGVAAGLHEMARNSDLVFMANYAQTVNVIGAIKTTKTAAAMETTGLVLRLYRNHFGTVPAAVTSDTYPLDVAAAWTADRRALTVGVVNPTEQAWKLPLTITGVDLEGSGRVWTIGNSDPMAYNQPGKVPSVTIEEKPLTGVSDALVVPGYSVTLYELKVQ
jgi:alpha-N-arabinofuranosidase